MPHSHGESLIGEMISLMVPNPVYVLKIDKLEVVPPQAQSSAFVLKPCPALSHIQRVIFPEAEVPPNKEAHVVRERAGLGGYRKGPVFSLLWMRRPRIVHKKINDQSQECRWGWRTNPLKNEHITDLPDSPRSKHRKGFEIDPYYCPTTANKTSGRRGDRTPGYRAKPA